MTATVHAPASDRQTFAIFCALKVNVQALKLTKSEAASYLDRAKKGTYEERVAAQEELIAKGGIKKGKINPDWDKIYLEAHTAGMRAGTACTPTPMIVQQHAVLFDDSSPVTKQWHVESGVCGFASIWFRGTSSFAKWAKKNGYAGNAYPSGFSVFVKEFGQSLERKTAYANAFAEVLRKWGINCHVRTRED